MPNAIRSATATTILLRNGCRFARRRSVRSRVAGPVDSSGRFEPGDRRDQIGARDVVRRRKRVALRVAWPLFRDRRPAVGAADDYAPKSTRRATELLGDNRLIVHSS